MGKWLSEQEHIRSVSYESEHYMVKLLASTLAALLDDWVGPSFPHTPPIWFLKIASFSLLVTTVRLSLPASALEVLARSSSRTWIALFSCLPFLLFEHLFLCFFLSQLFIGKKVLHPPKWTLRDGKILGSLSQIDAEWTVSSCGDKYLSGIMVTA